MPTADPVGEPESAPSFDPECRLVPESSRYAKKVVRDLRYNGGDLTIAIQGPGFSFAHVVFRELMGFRVLDEGDLIEYWNTYSEPHGWLWEVERGGWLDLERQRPTFWSGEQDSIREYFIADDHCINVLTWTPPEIIDLGTDPAQSGNRASNSPTGAAEPSGPARSPIPRTSRRQLR